MSDELRIIARFIDLAVCPEDVFGGLFGVTKTQQLAALRKAYLPMVKVIHPDKNPLEKDLAQEAFKTLELMKVEAEKLISSGKYGMKIPIPGKAPIVLNGKYVRDKSHCAGNVADVHLGHHKSSHDTIIIKACRVASDNDLMTAELTALNALHKKLPVKSWGTCIPKVIDSFLVDRRKVNILEYFDGFYTAEEIHQRLPGGIDGQTLVWMWKRLIVLMEWAHKTGYIHGAILPSHIMFYPDNDGNPDKDIRKHSIRLVDWCYSVEYAKRTRLTAWIPEQEVFYAPEIPAKKPLGPWTDLYMGAQAMVYLSGGDPTTRKFPSHIPKELADAIHPCLHKVPSQRPTNLGTYFEQLVKVAKKVYGEPKYHAFNL